MWRLRPFTFFAASLGSGSEGRLRREAPFFRRLHALCVDDRRCRAGLPALLLAQHHHEMMTHALPHARTQEGAEVAINRGPGRKGRRGWQVAPLAAGPDNVEQAIK